MHVFSTLCLASSLSTLALAGPVGRRSVPAPLLRARDADLVAGKYIVVMNQDASTEALDDEVITTYTSIADSVYNSTIRGFAGVLDEASIEELRNHPGVAYIEQDTHFKLAKYVVQNGATWGISRLSRRQNDNKNSQYHYDDSAGAGTCTYIIDTGIQATHVEFSGRAEFVKNFSGDGHDGDGDGHGTYVAGIIGSDTYGVAKKTQLLGLKVFNDDGATTGTAVLDAMDFAASDHPTRKDKCPKGFAVNMSLGGGFSQASNDAADVLVDSGVFVAVASGNDGKDAKDVSPASAKKVCTVGATNEADAMSSFSNFGEVVDVFAPGEDIASTAFGDSNKETTTASGTSASSPHIAGLAAYLMGLEGEQGGVALCKRIKELSDKEIIQGVPGGTANRLAFNGSPS